jgi:hypothetical protein
MAASCHSNHFMKYFLFVASLAFLFGCGGGDEPEPISAKLLSGSSSKTWYLTDHDLVGTADFEDQPACVQDDRWIFYAIGTMEQNEGATKCTPTDPQVYVNGSWELFTESQTLRLTRSTIINFTIVKLTANVMVLKNGSDKMYFAKE